MASFTNLPGRGSNCLCILAVVLGFCAGVQAGGFAGGTGAPDDPYQIATAEQLIAMGADPNLYDKCFVLTGDIDLDPCLPGGKAFERAVIAPVRRYGPSPQTPAFTGCLDGQGHTIRHLTVQGVWLWEEHLGLIGFVGPGGRIRAVTLEDVQIQGGGWSGSLAGRIDRGFVDHCRSSGRVSGEDGPVGGLVGGSAGTTYVGCQASCSVSLHSTSGEGIGGLIGWNSAGTVSDCSATGNVSVEGTVVDYVGGLVGWNEGGVVSRCLSTGAVDAHATGLSGVGGFIGWNEGGVVSSCLSAGAVNARATGLSGVGGLVGGLADGAILDCYTTSAVSVDGTRVDSAGGLVGNSVLGRIERSYAAGALVPDRETRVYVGGLVGYNHGTCVHGLWDRETSGFPTSNGGLGLGTAEMEDPAIYSLNGWGGDPNWVMEPGDYPHLAWEGKPGRSIPEAVIDWLPGQGSSDDPYRITQAAQLARLGLASILWERHFLLATDLDLKNVALRPLGAVKGMEFQGRFHGAGRVLANLSLDVAQEVGLFGCLGANGQVDDLGLRDVQLLAARDANAVGAVAGLNQGTIARCFATGSIRLVDGVRCLGGLVGINEGLVEDCYAQVTTGPEKSWFRADSLGGLIGFNRAGQVSHCYATEVTNVQISEGKVGGLVGLNTGQVLWSLWDMQTSGWSTSDGGLGFDTAEMKDAEVYALNGWAQEPDWVIQSGIDYPRLVWQASAGSAMPPAQIDEFPGQGTPDDPYRVTQASQLARIGRAACLWDKCFTLEADLNLVNEVLRPIGVGGGMAFGGSFDGHGHVLRNLSLGTADSRATCEGFFGAVEKTGTIRNLKIENGRVAGGAYSSGLGLLAGHNAGDIDNCAADGTVTAESGSSDVGGLVGLNSGTLLACTANATVAGPHYVTNFGQLAGVNSGAIHGCVAEGTVITATGSTSDSAGGTAVGGLVGSNAAGVLSGCQSRGTVMGWRDVGGLCGFNAGVAFHCEALGSVSCVGDSVEIGGLVGRNSTGLVMMCSAAGPVTGRGAVTENGGGIGGLAGCNYGIVERSNATGDTVGSYNSSSAGGLLGYNARGMVIDCYGEGQVLAADQPAGLGGLVGIQSGILVNGYASGAVRGESDRGRVGGLAGYNRLADPAGIISNGFFLSLEEGGGPDNGYGTPLSGQQIQSIESFVDWDFYGRSADGREDVWFMPQGRPPVLSWQAPETGLAVVPSVVGLTPEQGCAVLECAGFQVGTVCADCDRSIPAGRAIGTKPMLTAPAGATVDLIVSTGPYVLDENPGDGTAENPYQIATAGELEALADYPEAWSRCFVLTRDIDLSCRLFDRALIAPNEGRSSSVFQGVPFTGQFDGTGHTIHHLSIMASPGGYLGLFGMIGENGRVINLRLDGVRIAGSQSPDRIGSIAGHSQGILLGCRARGLICGGNLVNALVGWNEGTLSECSSQVLVQGSPDDGYGRRR